MMRDDRREAVAYLICGFVSMGVSWAAQFGVSAVCFQNPRYPTPWQNFILGMSNWTAGMLTAYILNRRLVFRSHAAIGPEFLKFLVSRLGTLGVDMGLRQILPMAGLDVYAVTLLAAAVITVLNYVIGKLAVFRKKGDVLNGSDE